MPEAREQMGVKAMNCPGHMLVFASEVRSYRDLPLRLHEQTPLHRNEASGVLSGLTRVRQFSQDDAHCFVTPEQIGDEVERLHRGWCSASTRDFGLPFTAKLVDAARRSSSARSRRGTTPRPQLEAALDAGRQAVHDQRRRRRLLRAEDRLRRHRRHRAEMAVRHDSARLPDARSVST